MFQIFQNLKNKELALMEVPVPTAAAGKVLVKNVYSVISAGTEGKSAETAKSGYIAKAKAKPNEVKKVLDSVKARGVRSTYEIVMNRLSTPTPLGYSCAGVVIEVGTGVSGFEAGDRVACAGADASHAEFVSVPVNLCARVPAGVEHKKAAFTTLGAIALQGVRRADLRIGESCAVIGLGLLGQLTIQLLRAGGIRAVGIDLEEDKVRLAEISGADLALLRSSPDLDQHIENFTNGIGVDAVIITAGTNSLDPVELAGNLCRKKGKVIIVGNVPTGFSRENYYKKELDLRMSCSYGPGRYDPVYEEKGIDYPVAFVRWTEKRNMEAFLGLMASGRIDLSHLITHEFDFEDALKAYEVILEKSEPYVGIVLAYSEDIEPNATLFLREKTYLPGRAAIGCIGAGSYAQNILLPILSGEGQLVGIADAKPNISRHAADKYQVRYATSDPEKIFKDPDINTVFITTPHHLHAEFVIKALKKGKNVFVEKPLCLNESELEEIKSEYEKREVHLMVGFNRRFAPNITQLMKRVNAELPVAINYRVNAGILMPDHWVHDKEIGGGRIIGEVCHFIDLCMFISGSQISHVSGVVMRDPHDLEDSLIVNLEFENGSIASISYLSNGNKHLKKEHLEVFSGGMVFQIDDFQKITSYTKRVTSDRLKKVDKGHAEEIRRFLGSVEGGTPTPISFDEILMTTRATFKLMESIRTNKVVSL